VQSVVGAPHDPDDGCVIVIANGSQPSRPFDQSRNHTRPSGAASTLANETDSHPDHVRPDRSLLRWTVYEGSAGLRTTSVFVTACSSDAAGGADAEAPNVHAVSSVAIAVARGKAAMSEV
jgi:hypothetical protein